MCDGVGGISETARCVCKDVLLFKPPFAAFCRGEAACAQEDGPRSKEETTSLTGTLSSIKRDGSASLQCQLRKAMAPRQITGTQC